MTRSDRTHWTDTDDPRRFQRGAYGAGVLWTLGILALCLLVGLIVFAIKTATADPAGKAGAYRTQRSATNRIFQQQLFEDRYNDIKATDRKLDVLTAAAAAGDLTAKQTLTGTTTYCLDAVGQYNADSRKYLAADFKSADLPAQIDDTDPATDCKPTEKK